MLSPIRLDFRSLLLVKGAGSMHFLQGLITKDMEYVIKFFLFLPKLLYFRSVNSANLIYTFLLNVKGRIFTDMFIWRLAESQETYALEMDSSKLDALQKALKIYRLRRPIKIEPIQEREVHFCAVKQPQEVTKKFKRINGQKKEFMVYFRGQALIGLRIQGCPDLVFVLFNHLRVPIKRRMPHLHIYTIDYSGALQKGQK
jgi:folate-binding Fe-S cluster repair protein YgfZ